MSHFHHVLITGAAGALGSELRKSGQRLGKRVRLTDRAPCAGLAGHEDDAPADLADFQGVMQAVQGCDAIVHMGAVAREAPWEQVLHSNVIGAYNIYEAARRCGVKRVVYASSVHATGFYERNHTIDALAPTRPDTLYGVSKTFGENLASFYFDKFGIESVSLRIGSCLPEPADRRHLVTWLSYRDCRQLVELSLSAPRVGHLISFAASANGEAFWDNRLASILGYKPEDSSDAFRERILADVPQGDPNDPAVKFQGGSYCALGHPDD